LEKADLLEYSTELNLNYDKKKGAYDNDNDDSSFSNLQNSINISNSDKENKINIKDYENIVMKIDNITITEEKTYKQLKENLIYLECKVPLFKVEKKTSFVNNNNQEKNKPQNQGKNKSQEKQKQKVEDQIQIPEKENIFYDTFK
jgi:hypothetical protein